MDFTPKMYKLLLESLIKSEYSFQTVRQSIEKSIPRSVIARHDIDLLPHNSIQFARIQSEYGIKGSYYFRIVPGSFNQKIIEEISSLGHEIGYHYEDVSLAFRRQRIKSKIPKFRNREKFEKYLIEVAIISFSENLARFRNIAPVETITMHGSPLSQWDSRLLWKYFDYHDFGITSEPYFDVNFDKSLYLTDTGRRWDGGTVSIRDKGLSEVRYNEWKVKPISGSLMNMKSESVDFQNKNKFRLTSEIISAAEREKLPDRIMMTFHPQRWTDKPGPWVKELVWQNVKNLGKYFLVKLRD